MRLHEHTAICRWFQYIRMYCNLCPNMVDITKQLERKNVTLLLTTTVQNPDFPQQTISTIFLFWNKMGSIDPYDGYKLTLYLLCV